MIDLLVESSPLHVHDALPVSRLHAHGCSELTRRLAERRPAPASKVKGLRALTAPAHLAAAAAADAVTMATVWRDVIPTRLKRRLRGVADESGRCVRVSREYNDNLSAADIHDCCCYSFGSCQVAVVLTQLSEVTKDLH